VRKQLADNDRQVLYGQATSLSSNNDRRQGRRVAVVSHQNSSPVELQPGNDIEHLFLLDTGRWQETLIPTDGPGGHIIVANIYGYPKTGSVKMVFLMNERILKYALKRATPFPSTPYFVGDINVNPSKSKEINSLVLSGAIRDIASEWTPPDSPIQNAFLNTGIHPGMEGSDITRIDAPLGNIPAAHIVHNFSYVWDAISFDHSPLCITISHNDMYTTYHYLAATCC